MRTATIIIFLLAFITSCTNNNLDWIVGSWERANDKEGQKTYEKWEKRSNTEYLGFGFTLENSDTVFKENLSIVKINDNWNLKVTGVNSEPTLFPFVAQSENMFICENKANEFPKRIKYFIQSDTLKAIISDDEREILFVFKKAN